MYLAFVGILLAYGIDASLPAFDQLREQFDLDARGVSPSIIITVYFFGIAAGQLVWGLLSDRFGRQPVLLAATGFYAAGAIGSAFAPNLEMLLASRVLWGFGAAALNVLRFAIARDLFAGDQMARVVSTFSAIFLLGPIFAPVISEGILVVGNYQAVFGFGVFLAALVIVWTIRFGETLAPEHRRELRFGPIVETFRAILATRITLWIGGVQIFATAAFLIWLGSSQPIIDRVYGRESQFAIFFGISGLAMGASLLIVKPYIEQIGARRIAVFATAGYVAACAVGSIMAFATNGVPSVWAWFGWALVANVFSILVAPMSVSLALEPMADKAGTASSLLGVAQFGIGSTLAAVVDGMVDTTVTPMIVGSLVFGVASLACLLMALRPTSSDSVRTQPVPL